MGLPVGGRLVEAGLSEATDGWRFEGVLDITCPYEDTNELLLPTIAERARSIE